MPYSKAKKAKRDKKINARPKQIKKRVESNKKRRQAKRKGQNVNGKDYDHKTNRFISVKANRGKKNEGGRKKIKRGKQKK